MIIIIIFSGVGRDYAEREELAWNTNRTFGHSSRFRLDRVFHRFTVSAI